MTDDRSYDPDREGAGRAAELERLASQVDLWWEEEARYLSSLGIPNGASVVSLGCGPGLWMTRFADRFTIGNLRKK